MRALKLWKIIVRGLNRVFEARLSAFKGGGLESNNTHSVWSVELLSKQAIVRMQGLAIRGHRGGEKSYPQDQQRWFIWNKRVEEWIQNGYATKKKKLWSDTLYWQYSNTIYHGNIWKGIKSAKEIIAKNVLVLYCFTVFSIKLLNREI